MEPTRDQIEGLRSAFLKDLDSKGGESYIHQADLNRVKSTDDWLRRFLLHHDCNHNDALKMLWSVVEWRKDFKSNDINEININMEYMVEGGMFPRGRDKDGNAILIFKCKKHVKGTKDMDQLKRCVVYWFERLEKQEHGKPISIFFDMEGCGLSNMDMEFTKYLIGLFKEHYPYFLNYIIIYEMAWILNAAFKIIKSWLPEKAVQKIKMLKKNSITDYVPIDQALICWGGNDDYVYSFVPEPVQEEILTNSNNNKKVHFAVGSSPMSESAATIADKDHVSDGGILSVNPPGVITFSQDGNEMVSFIHLQNTDQNIKLSYKMKTTSPEKFRVRPSAGCLGPGEKATISVHLLPGFQLGGLSRDKFLLMSMPVDSVDMTTSELTDLWKMTNGKSFTQHRLRCSQADSASSGSLRNGSAIGSSGNSGDMDTGSTSANMKQIAKLNLTVTRISEAQAQLSKTVEHMQLVQYGLLAIIVILLAVLVYVSRSVGDIRGALLDGGDSTSPLWYKGEQP